ncbi:hypothetical protein PV04_04432 [Phialophora macrospora]|uniref:Major facilitator superfamily (MFS) profile domain-containing protein n=1 Tax=Phialophora macrospora TaxID=1851006 RepID=A0A0D2FPK0_9EURO|nr:hypothetical protein PV04_04432 [Phialophora macrospora]
MGVEVLVENGLSTGPADVAVRVHAKTIIVVASIDFIYFAQLTGVVGSGLLAQPIGQLFNGAGETVWLGSVVNILTLALSPALCQAADYWGRKWFLVITSLFGCAGSITVSRAHSMGTVVAGFTIMSVAYGSQPLLHAVVSEVLPRKQRPLAQATVNMTAATGAVIGLLMGGALLKNGNLKDYRIYWYVTAGIFFVAASGCALCYNPPPRDLQSALNIRAKLQQLDWIGYFLVTPGVVLFCIGLSWSKNPYGWDNAHILGPCLIGVPLMLAFGVYEWRFKKDGILHHNLFKNRNFAIALFTIFVEGLAFFAANAYYAYQVTVFTQSNFLITAVHFSVTFLTAIASAFLTAMYSIRKKAIRGPSVFAFSLILVFFIMMAVAKPNTHHSLYWAAAVILGMGLGILLPSIMVAAQLSTPQELISVVSGLVIATRSLGAAIGLAINNAIFNGVLSSNIPTKVAAAVVPLGLPPSSIGPLIGALAAQDPAAFANVPGVTPQIIQAGAAAVLDSYGVAFQNAWILSCCFCFLAITASFFFRDPHGEFTGHIDAPAEAKLVEEQKRLEATHHKSAADVASEEDKDAGEKV